jgi:hypothetical protein
LRGTSLAAGLASGSGPLSYGGFFEGIFVGTYGKDSLSDGSSVTGYGRARALGVGFFSSMNFQWNNLAASRLEGMFRAGSLHSHWQSKSSVGDGEFVGSVPYLGIRLGTSHSWNRRGGIAIDLYGRCSLTHLPKKTELAEGTISFRSVTSSRIRLGGRIALPPDRALAPWFGAYIERELAGTAKGTVDGKVTPTTSLKGNCLAGSLGLSYRPLSAVSVDVFLQGSVGTKKSVKLSYCAIYEL